MKTTLIDALLATSAGPEIRKILRLQDEPLSYPEFIREALKSKGEGVMEEVLRIRLRRVAENNSFCDVYACIAKIEGGEFAQDAADIMFRCSGVTALDWHSSFYDEKDRPELESPEGSIEIETEDSFRIVCTRIEVLSVQLEKLGG